MTGRKSAKAKKRVQRQQPAPPQQQQQPAGPQSTSSANLPQSEDSPPNNIKKEQPPQPQIVKKILKAENEEARTLKTVFKSNPDSQMKDFIKIAVKKPAQAAKTVAKTPAENHPPAVAQELMDTDDDVADNLSRLFKASKSYKNL